jgi:hypothetical protein
MIGPRISPRCPRLRSEGCPRLVPRDVRRALVYSVSRYIDLPSAYGGPSHPGRTRTRRPPRPSARPPPPRSALAQGEGSGQLYPANRAGAPLVRYRPRLPTPAESEVRRLPLWWRWTRESPGFRCSIASSYRSSSGADLKACFRLPPRYNDLPSDEARRRKSHRSISGRCSVRPTAEIIVRPPDRMSYPNSDSIVVPGHVGADPRGAKFSGAWLSLILLTIRPHICPLPVYVI